jgi:cold shock CspA family protein
MPEGTIKNLVRDRGFGFILPDEAQGTSDDLFFHRSDVDGTVSFEQLRVQQHVSYELGRDERRGSTKAIHVRPLPAA